MFENTSNLQLNSPVRIAGVEVGKVTKIERAAEDSTVSEVTMEIEETALPIHEDAELKIRPRIFLEGNFFVDLKPGHARRRTGRRRRHDPADADQRARCSSTRCWPR